MSVIPLRGEPVVARASVTIACTAVGAPWRTLLGSSLDSGVWRWRYATAERYRALDRFARIRAGDRGLLIHGFHWRDPVNAPRNSKGTRYGPRAPRPVFQAQGAASEYVVFEVTDEAYREDESANEDNDPRAWGLCLPFRVLAHHRAELAFADLNPVVAEALRRSAIDASFPSPIAPASIAPPLRGRSRGDRDRCGSSTARELVFPELAAAEALMVPINTPESKESK